MSPDTAKAPGVGPRVSVVLCTWNRAAALQDALASLLNQDDAPPYEVVVVDNASTDATRDVVQSLMPRSPQLRYVFESRQGLSHARNTGVAASRGQLVAFTDDDVRVGSRWVRDIVDAFERYPGATCVGGPALPHWPEPPPAWLTRAHWPPLGVQDYGDEPFRVDATRPVCLIGANLAFRREALESIGGFHPAFQRVESGIGSTEDHECHLRLWRTGRYGVYEPRLTVSADVSRDRLTRRHHRAWHYGHGRHVARMRLPEIETTSWRVLGIPGHQIRQGACALGAWLKDTILRRGKAGPQTRTRPAHHVHPFDHEARLWFLAGFVWERWTGGGAHTRVPDVQAAAATRHLFVTPAEPLVSIVIPCYNHARFLGEAIESALGQTWHRTEVIVVLDGCTDDSAVVASRYPRARVVSQDNQGLARARNTGIREARGDVLIFLDADDRLAPGAARAAVETFTQRPDAAMVHGRCRLVDEHGNPMRTNLPVVGGDAYSALLRSNFIWTPAIAAIRREVLSIVGAFDPRVNASADYDLYLRIARLFPIAASSSTVADYRQHGTSMSRNPVLMLDTTLDVLRRQRPFTIHDPSLDTAFRESVASWRAFYGEFLVERFRRHLHAGRRREALADAFHLLRLHPRGVRFHVLKKTRLLLRGLRDFLRRSRLRDVARS